MACRWRAAYSYSAFSIQHSAERNHMDELFDFEFPPFAITEMDFLSNKEVHRIQQHIA